MNFRIIAFLVLSFFSTLSFSQKKELRESIDQIIQSKKATVGVSILGLENRDTLSINGNKMFPMFSVVKFYMALAVLHEIDKGNLTLDTKVKVTKADLNPNTYSPMRDSMPSEGFEITVEKLLNYSITVSDNIAYEKLAELLGGIQKVNEYIRQFGIKEIAVVSTYKEGLEATLKNRNSPLAAVYFLEKAYNEKLLSKKSREFLWNTMLSTTTGSDRIKGLLPIGTPVAHKTGSSGMENGLTLAFNDIGVVTLPSGKHFAIAVFITDSKETDQVNARIIAEITEVAWQHFTGKKK